jgi:tetratricopeptide (TPR) repeat protein
MNAINKRNKKNDIELLLILQNIYYFDGNHKKSVSIGNKILSLIPDNEKKINNPTYINVINSLCLSSIELDKDYTKYFRILKKYLSEFPEISPDIKETIGWCYIKQKEINIGEKLVYKSISEKNIYSNRGYSEINYHLGYSNFITKKYNLAETYFRKSIEYGNNNYFAQKSKEFLNKLRIQYDLSEM